jgi:hypothetical protein
VLDVALRPAALWTRLQRPRALIMSVLRELDVALSGDAEMLNDSILKLVLEYLSSAG